MIRSRFRSWKKLSATALSWQLPRRPADRRVIINLLGASSISRLICIWSGYGRRRCDPNAQPPSRRSQDQRRAEEHTIVCVWKRPKHHRIRQPGSSLLRVPALGRGDHQCRDLRRGSSLILDQHHCCIIVKGAFMHWWQQCWPRYSYDLPLIRHRVETYILWRSNALKLSTTKHHRGYKD